MGKEKEIRMILRQLNGEADKSEKGQFSQWLLEKPENLDLYIDVKGIWQRPNPVGPVFSETLAKKLIGDAVQKNKKKVQIWQLAQQVAALVLILISIGAVFYYRTRETPPPLEEANEIVKAITKKSCLGEQLRVTLPDGSIVYLNAGSSIRYPEKFAGNIRRIVLKGEAFFDVARDSLHPFVVCSDNLKTTVLGTTFNIKTFANERNMVTVASGKVKVENTNPEQSGELLLLPNQQAVYNPGGKHFKITEVDADNFIAWKNGIIRFNNDPLSEVIKILERWYNVKIELEGIEHNKIYIKGSYKDKKLFAILDGFKFMYNLDYYYKNDTSIVIRYKQQKQ